MEMNQIFAIGILFRLCLATIMEKRIKMMHYWDDWNADERTEIPRNQILILPRRVDTSSRSLQDLIFTRKIVERVSVYTHATHVIHSMPETVAHRILRSSKKAVNQSLKRVLPSIKADQEESKMTLVPEHLHRPRPPISRHCQQTTIPSFICDTYPKVQASPRKLYVSSSSASCAWRRHEECGGKFGQRLLWLGCERALSVPSSQQNFNSRIAQTSTTFSVEPQGGISACTPVNGWSNIIVPDKQTLVTDAGKLSVLDSLLRRLKEQGHRVLIYSQMTKMIDLLEEYMYHRKHTFMRLDGSSKISDRRDMVADFQKRADIFVFLLSTRAGGLGINLTAADTVIFYDSDWNPTVDQQAMDRAHRLGQTKQVTVYRLICKGTIEERILQRAREKSEIQRMVISGGNFKPDTLKPKEVVSLLLDDEEIEAKYSQRSEERKQHAEDARLESSLYHKERDRKRKLAALPVKGDAKKPCLSDANGEKAGDIVQVNSNDSNQAGSNAQSHQVNNHQQMIESLDDYSVSTSPAKSEDETSNDGLVVDVDGPVGGPASDPRPLRVGQFGEPGKANRIDHHIPFSGGTGARIRPTIRGTSKRGRPRGSRRGGPVGGKGRGLLLLHPPSSKGVGGSDPQSPASMSPTSSTTTIEQTLQHGGQATSGPAEGDGPSSVGPLGPVGTLGPLSGRGGPPTVRRGPGRPRLRPSGPGHQGYRTPGHHHGRKVQRPLPVPLRSQQTIATVNQQKSPVQRPSGSSGSSVSSASLNAASSFPSSAGESRPFGFYTQQQQQQSRGSS